MEDVKDYRHLKIEETGFRSIKSAIQAGLHGKHTVYPVFNGFIPVLSKFLLALSPCFTI